MCWCANTDCFQILEEMKLIPYLFILQAMEHRMGTVPLHQLTVCIAQ